MNSCIPDLHKSLVRILVDDQMPARPVGSGFFVSPHHIMTCAHVVADSLGIPRDSMDMPVELIYLDFPLLERHTPLSARVQKWHPVKETSAVGELEDIAILELINDASLPVAAQTVTGLVLDPNDFFDRPVRMCGFPQGMDDGDWLTGKCQGMIRTGWVQLDNEFGRRGIAPGFSGTAVWDIKENTLAGMMVSIDTRASDTIAYMIPMATLVKAWQPLHQQSHILTSTNPYYPWNPVISPRFVGRIKELRQLEIALEEGGSVSLVGDRRIGKSSVLKVWEKEIYARGRVVISLSGEDRAAQSLSTFVQTITGFQSSDEPDPAADVLAHWAEQQGVEGLPPILLVDEVGACLRDFPNRFFERLRGMLDHLLLVLSSHQDIDKIYRDLGHTSPLGNRLRVIGLGLLEEEAANKIIQWSFEVLNQDMNVQSIMQEWAGRHPFYLQLLGHHLVNAQCLGSNMNDAMDDFWRNAKTHLHTLWNDLEPREQEALRKSLQGLPVTRRSLRTRGLVTENGQLFGRVLREWLEQEA